jgi:hypothetical protein
MALAFTDVEFMRHEAAVKSSLVQLSESRDEKP